MAHPEREEGDDDLPVKPKKRARFIQEDCESEAIQKEAVPYDPENKTMEDDIVINIDRDLTEPPQRKSLQFPIFDKMLEVELN